MKCLKSKEYFLMKFEQELFLFSILIPKKRIFTINHTYQLNFILILFPYFKFAFKIATFLLNFVDQIEDANVEFFS